MLNIEQGLVILTIDLADRGNINRTIVKNAYFSPVISRPRNFLLILQG